MMIIGRFGAAVSSFIKPLLNMKGAIIKERAKNDELDAIRYAMEFYAVGHARPYNIKSHYRKYKSQRRNWKRWKKRL